MDVVRLAHLRRFRDSVHGRASHRTTPDAARDVPTEPRRVGEYVWHENHERARRKRIAKRRAKKGYGA